MQLEHLSRGCVVGVGLEDLSWEGRGCVWVGLENSRWERRGCMWVPLEHMSWKYTLGRCVRVPLDQKCMCM